MSLSLPNEREREVGAGGILKVEEVCVMALHVTDLQLLVVDPLSELCV